MSEAIKIWHDDVRPAPEGWKWARTNEQAQHLLDMHEVEEISLDHDLGLDHLDADADPTAMYRAGMSQDGSGLDLARWMVAAGRVPAKVTIHSWNPDGATRMANVFRDSGYDVVVEPYSAHLVLARLGR